MTHVLERHRYRADIVERETGRTMARVYITERKPYPVCDHRGRFLFAAWELEEALEQFERRCMNWAVPWEPVYSSKSQDGLPHLALKRTPHAELGVLQKSRGEWIALRDGAPLLEFGRLATFPSCGAAQAAADEYGRLGWGSGTEDGFHWAQDPEEVYEGDEDESVDLKVARLLQVKRPN
jgi:hypothetical protein